MPVVNYDVYRYGYGDYRECRVVIAADGREAFGRALRSLADAAAREAAAAAQRADSDRWGRMDGRSGQRVLALFDAMVEGNGGKA